MSPESSEDTSSAQPVPPISNELELVARRELAIRTTDAISEVLDRDITVRGLERMATNRLNRRERLTGVRALRCLEAIARHDSEVVKAVGETGIYHFVEGVIQYGADEKKYLSLVDKEGLSAEQVTGLYAVRELIAGYTEGRPTFPAIEKALATLGMSLADAADDPEHTVERLDEAGYFIDNKGKRIFDRPIMAPNLADRSARVLEDDPDGTLSQAILDAQRADISRPLDEIEDEGEDRVAREVIEILSEINSGLR